MRWGGVSEGLLPEEAVGRSPTQTTSSQNLYPQNQAGAAAPSPAWQAACLGSPTQRSKTGFSPQCASTPHGWPGGWGNELAGKDTLICFSSPKAASGSMGEGRGANLRGGDLSAGARSGDLPRGPSREQPNPWCLRTKSCGLIETTLPSKDGPHRRPWHGPNSARRVGISGICRARLQGAGTTRNSRSLISGLRSWVPRHLAGAQFRTDLALATSRLLILVHGQHLHVKLAETFGPFWLSIFSGPLCAPPPQALSPQAKGHSSP